MNNEPKKINGLTEGRMVHYVLPDGKNAGEHRAAIVVRVFDHYEGTSNLSVFTDGSNDFIKGAPGWRGTLSASSVLPDQTKKEPGTWHWIEHV